MFLKEVRVSDGKVIEFADVTMVFGDAPAVDGLTARVDPGRVTAFLGPNGAGKTTTLRILLGDLRATRGRATIGGTEYQRIVRPAASIGAVMSIAPLERSRRKTVAKHLAKAARRVGVGSGRVREVLTIVGLGEMHDMRIGSLSLGMKHRLAVAEALLGDPNVLVFDEPANGLDPEGIRWIRLLMRRFADEGRTVLMSSHLLSEVEQVADSLVVLSEGRLLFEGPIELLSETEGGLVTVDADDRAALTAALDEAGLEYRVLRSGVAIDDTTTTEIGSLAAGAGVALTTLTHRGPSLEDIYLQIIDGSWSAPARTAALDPGAAAELFGEESGAAAADPAEGGDVAADGDAPSAEADDAADDDGSPQSDLVDDVDAVDDDDETARGAATGVAAGAVALPGAAGLAGLVHGLRSDDESEDDESPAEAAADGAESPIDASDVPPADGAEDGETTDDAAQEERVADEDEWEAQLRAMFDDGAAASEAVATTAFPAASFSALDDDAD
ncbi:ATP-binding cassette domain-containing protein [Microbacterium karelineae]|uniref:ATP-binding cassette domain-containing protein n=1 Tax=Microbacterium karelineae TaxID=2654283 RepID=UPI0012EA8E65|nr:ATP-binding cassette domain-containing protein [Microbacterium karelineae]